MDARAVESRNVAIAGVVTALFGRWAAARNAAGRLSEEERPA